MQDTALNPHGINIVSSAISLLLGGGVIGVIIKGLIDRREQRARTEKIRAEVVSEQIGQYKGFSEAMRLMREDVDEIERKLREMKRGKEQAERERDCAEAELARANERLGQLQSLAEGG